ncbi:hypothetical protein X777_05496 [Ooceraea biroi]|uniref:Uncharacterized protein n=1 Tax=Ooceraea biroi TaxID=2015173 RepID=A0A026WID3_OOCBI|nr:hypothetical protein X777_05496 [Ooceraea biroi]
MLSVWWGGMCAELSTMSSYQEIKLSIRTSTVSNWKEFRQNSRNSDPNLSIVKVSSSTRTTFVLM